MAFRIRSSTRALIFLSSVGTTVVAGCLAPAATAATADSAELVSIPSEEAVEQVTRVENEAERLRAVRRAEAAYVELFGPFFTLEAGTESRLFLMNTSPDTIAVDIAVRNDMGVELPLGQYTIEPLRHLEILLGERLRGFREDFSFGVVRLGLLGDAETLQAWTVLETPDGGAFEVPFIVPAEMQSGVLTAFWGAADKPTDQIELRLTNTSSTLVGAELTVGNGRDVILGGDVSLGPGQSKAIHVPSKFARLGGYAQLTHDGEPGDVVATGLSKSRGYIGAFSFSGDNASIHSVFEAIPMFATHLDGVDVIGASPHIASLTLFNPGSERKRVTVSLLDAHSSTTLESRFVDLKPREVRDITVPVPGAGVGHGPRPIRVRVEATEPPLLVSGRYRKPGEQWIDLALFSQADAHSMGTYPLPNVEEYATRTTLVNLGEDPSRVVAQVYWRGGAYAFGPFDVPAGGFYRIDLEALAKNGSPDVLARTLDVLRPEGVLKWRVMAGSRSLIGRTEASRRGTADRFGFNCFGCCWEFVRAAIVPGEVSFPLGQSRMFESCMTVSDCAGTMGPYPITPYSTSVPYPFIWDAQVVGAEAAADDVLSFETIQTETSPTCLTTTKTFTGFGMAKVCQKTFNPKNYKPSETCASQTTDCKTCEQCCFDIAAQRHCQKKRTDWVESEKNTCLGVCLTTYEGNGCE